MNNPGKDTFMSNLKSQPKKSFEGQRLARLPSVMRAVALDRYGSADELRARQIPRPECGENELIVRVRAAGINPIDWRIRSGSLRLLLPAKFPLVLGFDAAGEIAEVGTGTRQKGWVVGDEVLCFLASRHGGSYAEYAVASADVVARKPAKFSWEEAAAVPLAASTALQSLRDLGNISSGDEVLVNGASGGVGIFAVQLAKSFGARVTGVCSEANINLVRELGAHEIIDYEREDFTSRGKRYRIVFDAVAKSSYSKCRPILTANGCYITTLPSPRSVFYQFATKLHGPRCRNILVRPRAQDLQLLAKMIEDGRLRAVVQQVYGLEDAAAAHRVSEAGHVSGKLVLRIDDSC